jgi:hypothetical protein
MDWHPAPDADPRKPQHPITDSQARDNWRAWAAWLRSSRLDGLAALLLEAAGPVGFVSAQLLYMGRPLIGPGAAQLAGLLESGESTKEFLTYLSTEGEEVRQSLKEQA